MEKGNSSTTRILVIEPDEHLRALLCTVLEEEGHQTRYATSLQRAFSLVDEQSFHLILADVYLGRSSQSFAEARILRRHVSPTPLGVLTTQNIGAADAAGQGFAFMLHMPFDLDMLLEQVAAQVNPSLSAEQARQAEVVQHFFAALDADDWETIKTLCADDITLFPSDALAFFDESKRVRGINKYLAYLQKIKYLYPGYATEDRVIYGRPRGLAVRYQVNWLVPNRTRHIVGTSLFHFQGEHIRQMSVSMNLEQLLGGTGR